MIKFFRNIRRRLLRENRITRYLIYAIGEIILVVIGILIALQINNWNEDKKATSSEIYILSEIRNNLREDAVILHEIIDNRNRTALAIDSIKNLVNKDTVDKNSLEKQLLTILTFERYFPINQAYEVLKSKGLQLSSNHILTQLSRYYDYEQKIAQQAVYDIEVTILDIYNDSEGIFRNVDRFEKDELINLKSIDPEFLQVLNAKLLSFNDNNRGTLNRIKDLYRSNQQLIKEIDRELIDLKK